MVGAHTNLILVTVATIIFMTGFSIVIPALINSAGMHLHPILNQSTFLAPLHIDRKGLPSTEAFVILVGDDGFEPPTPCL